MATKQDIPSEQARQETETESRSQQNMHLHMLEQVDGLERRLTAGARCSLNLVDATFPPMSKGAADELETAIDSLTTLCMTESSFEATCDHSMQPVESKRQAERTLQTLHQVRLQLMRIRTGLQCLRLDITDLGGNKLETKVNEENRICKAVKQNSRMADSETELRRTSSMPVLKRDCHERGFC